MKYSSNYFITVYNYILLLFTNIEKVNVSNSGLNNGIYISTFLLSFKPCFSSVLLTFVFEVIACQHCPHSAIFSNIM